VTGDVAIRFASADDAGILLELIRGLAEFEKAPEAVVATEDDLRRGITGPASEYEAVLAFDGDNPVGFALFHPRFSTWLGRRCMYLEDIFVTEAARGRGVGRALLARLAAITLARGWARIDFQVLDWNPARSFYARLGFSHLGEWLRYGADETTLRELAAHDAGT
jgi:GNAT superfamily N-acetyltransferase